MFKYRVSIASDRGLCGVDCGSLQMSHGVDLAGASIDESLTIGSRGEDLSSRCRPTVVSDVTCGDLELLADGVAKLTRVHVTGFGKQPGATTIDFDAFSTDAPRSIQFKNSDLGHLKVVSKSLQRDPSSNQLDSDAIREWLLDRAKKKVLEFYGCTALSITLTATYNEHQNRDRPSQMASLTLDAFSTHLTQLGIKVPQEHPPAGRPIIEDPKINTNGGPLGVSLSKDHYHLFAPKGLTVNGLVPLQTGSAVFIRGGENRRPLNR